MIRECQQFVLQLNCENIRGIPVYFQTQIFYLSLPGVKFVDQISDGRLMMGEIVEPTFEIIQPIGDELLGLRGVRFEAGDRSLVGRWLSFC